MKPRDYQWHCVERVFSYFEERTGNPVLALPTGTGKSLVIAYFLAEVFRRFRGVRAMVATHVKELIDQDVDKLLKVWPNAPIGIYSDGLGRKEFGAPITFAGVASAVNAVKEFGFIDLFIVDECHLVSPKDGTMYQTLINGLKEVNPKLKVIGLTATPYRVGQGMITDGGLFTDICVDMTEFKSFNWFLDEGYLVPLVPKRTSLEIDVSEVKLQNGEFNQAQLQRATDKEVITRAAIKEACHYGQDRDRWLFFAAGIEHAEHCAEELAREGVSVACIHSKLKATERDKRILDYINGRYRAMVNNGILTTGFDLPAIDMIAILRATMSPGLWVQLLGRGTRPLYLEGFDLSTTEGRLAAIAGSRKKNCLVLDFARNTQRLGPINDPLIPKKRAGGKGEAPVKLCEKCNSYCHASVTVCPFCGTIFERKVKFKMSAATDELIKRADIPEIVKFPVDSVTYREHRKQGSPSTLKVSYNCGLRVFHEWICFEHEGFPRHKAHQWWRSHAGGEAPLTVLDAIKRLPEVATPKSIQVWVNKKFPEVRSYEL